MKRKIFLNFLVAIIIGVSITGSFISQSTQKHYINEVEEKLKNSALLIQNQVLEELALTGKVDYNRAAQKYSSILNNPAYDDSLKINNHNRITFIDTDGQVVGESDTSYKIMENHLNRKEIQEALQGKIGFDTRFSSTLKVDHLYMAMPLKNTNAILRISVPLKQTGMIDELIWLYTIIGILSGLLVTILLALRFSSNVTKPIKELISVSSEISLGNYSKRVKIKSADEIGQLAETFNEMAETLEKTVADLTDKNIKVDSIINSMTSGIIAIDSQFRVMLINSIASEIFGLKYGPGLIGMNIIELVRNNQINNFLKDTIELNASLVNEINVSSPEEKVLRVHTNPIKSKDSTDLNSGGMAIILDITNIKKLELIRTEFVSNVTHELKTPLTSIRGFIETLRNGAINDKDVADKFLEIIDIEAERLYMLINDILQLSEIESKQKDSNIGSYNLKPIVEGTLSILQASADKKGIRFSCEIDDDLIITANRDRIKQMLINLVDNGIKYNIENGRIDIKAFKSQGKVNISIKDTGIGIPAEHSSRIFERFYRVDKGRSRSMGGTGLGLSIVKHIVNLYNGDIKVNSEPGKGTEFLVRFPV